MNNMNYTYLGTRYHKVHVFKSNVDQKKKKLDLQVMDGFHLGHL